MSARTRIALAALVAALSLVVVAAPASAGELDQHQDGPLAGYIMLPHYVAVGQTFTARESGLLDQVDLYLGRSPSPTEPLTVQIRNAWGDLPGSQVLASASVDPSQVPSSAFPSAWVSVPFEEPAAVDADIQYAIVIHTTDPIGSYQTGLTDSNPYEDGRLAVVQTDDPNWLGLDDSDLMFKTYVDTTSTTYDFTGFFSPVNNPTDPDPNSVKAGQSVPVKFSLGGDQGLAVLDDEAPNPKLVFSSCDPTDEADPVLTTPANNGLTYNALTDTYTYVWKTDKHWKGKCGTFTLKLDDGSVHTAEFLFK